MNTHLVNMMFSKDVWLDMLKMFNPMYEPPKKKKPTPEQEAHIEHLKETM
jgi:hypothetical protein